MTTAAWYILPSQRQWAKWFNLLHWPYTLWHLSYAVIGASMATDLDWALLGWIVLAFFLGMGIAAHALDLLQGDPLKQGLNPKMLAVVAAVALVLASLIGALQIYWGNVPVWLLVAILVGVLLSAGYNLEWPKFHGDWQFATWWAVFPFLVGYLAHGADFSPTVALMGVFLFITAFAQRVLSTRVRFLRRKTDNPYLAERYGDPVQVENGDWGGGKAWLLAADEKALGWMSAGMVVLALALLASHV